MRSISHRGPQGHSQGGHASAKHQIPKPQELRPQTAIQVLLQTAANKKHKQSIADESTSSHQTPITGANSYQEPLATELSPAAISLARSLARLQASLKSKPQHKQSSLGHKGLRPAPATPPSAKRPARSPTKSPQSPPCPEEPTQTAGSPLGDRLSRVERMASESSQHVRELERLDIPVLLQAHGSELSSLSESFDRLRDHLSEVQAGSDARSHAHSAALEELFGQMLQTLSTQLAGEIEALGTRLEQVAGAQERIEDTAAAAATAAVAAAAESAESGTMMNGIWCSDACCATLRMSWIRAAEERRAAGGATVRGVTESSPRSRNRWTMWTWSTMASSWSSVVKTEIANGR
eukprot:gnl/Dysnectes_brevis/1911_a2193_928.p1 GENE.gnl/Dysnectes_brevis/1911_a2193_928~~gnl/Dysnectes_brevis/1911_a2193_928.p1  ORF type:complete len:351 (-),score=94.83 gnl/Dysnectes_brevis/1911_a2193_928:245-1297(-)